MTLLDYPGKVAATVFSGGCNMRCPFCHNASLVFNETPQLVDIDEFFNIIQKRQKILRCHLHNGEPGAQDDLEEFMRRIKGARVFSQTRHQWHLSR